MNMIGFSVCSDCGQEAMVGIVLGIILGRGTCG